MEVLLKLTPFGGLWFSTLFGEPLLIMLLEVLFEMLFESISRALDASSTSLGGVNLRAVAQGAPREILGRHTKHWLLEVLVSVPPVTALGFFMLAALFKEPLIDTLDLFLLGALVGRLPNRHTRHALAQGPPEPIQRALDRRVRHGLAQGAPW